MVAELVETNRRYGRVVAEIDPSWIEQLSGHLTKTNYHDPHWHRKRCTVMAFERVSLFGLPIVAKRRVPYGSIDPWWPTSCSWKKVSNITTSLFAGEGMRDAGSDGGDRRRRRPQDGQSSQLWKRFAASDRAD